MSTGVVIGDLLAVADVGEVWANAGEGARATRSVTGKRRGEMAEAKFLAKRPSWDSEWQSPGATAMRTILLCRRAEDCGRFR